MDILGRHDNTDYTKNNRKSRKDEIRHRYDIKRRKSLQNQEINDNDKLRKNQENTIKYRKKLRSERIKRFRKNREKWIRNVEKALKQHDQAHVAAERAKLVEEVMPKLPSEAISELNIIKEYLSGSENKLSRAEYKDSFKRVFEILSPETIVEYKQYGIEDFALNDNMSHVTARRDKEGKENGKVKWKLNLPAKYEYPVQGMILRCFDEILKIETRYPKSTDQTLDRWVEVAARVFQVNMMLGTEYGWPTKGYKLAEEYRRNCEEGILKAYEDIGANASRDVLLQRAYQYANEQLRAGLESPPGVPRIFPPLLPGSFFEELNIKERTKRTDKLNKPSLNYRKARPRKLGTKSFYNIIKEISSKKEDDAIVLNIVIMPDKTIWALPRSWPDGKLSQHSMVAMGNPCVWSGEVTIKGKTVIDMFDQSGHYRTYSDNKEEQDAISEFALQAFRDHGYRVPSKVRLYSQTEHGKKKLGQRIQPTDKAQRG